MPWSPGRTASSAARTAAASRLPRKVIAPGRARTGAGADADQQRVVGEAAGVRRDRDVPVGVDRRPGSRARAARPGRWRSARAPCSTAARPRRARARPAGGTRSGRSRHSRSMLNSRSPRNERRARHASRPATPPPATTMRGVSGSAMTPCSTAGGAVHRGLPAAGCGFSVASAVAATAVAPAPRRARRARREALVGVLFGDPGRRAEAKRAAGVAGVVVEARRR